MRVFLLALLAAASARAQTVATGLDEEPRRGTFIETSVGAFTVFGGTPAVSNAQPYLSLSFGRQLGGRAAIFVSLGVSAAGASCFRVDPGDGSCAGADSFGVAFAELGASYGFAATPRTLVSLQIVAGATDLSPGPVPKGAGIPDSMVGFHGGAGVALDYATHLSHFAVGAGLLVRYTVASYTPAGQGSQSLTFVSLAAMPRIRYVF